MAIFTMFHVLLAVSILSVQILKDNTVLSFKNFDEYQKRLQMVKNTEFGAPEKFLTKAFKFINSGRDMMTLVADELWNIGEKAIDTIVDVEAKKRDHTKGGKR